MPGANLTVVSDFGAEDGQPRNIAVLPVRSSCKLDRMERARNERTNEGEALEQKVRELA